MNPLLVVPLGYLLGGSPAAISPVVGALASASPTGLRLNRRHQCARAGGQRACPGGVCGGCVQRQCCGDPGQSSAGQQRLWLARGRWPGTLAGHLADLAGMKAAKPLPPALALLGLVPAVGLACLGVFLTGLAVSRIVSISSVLAQLLTLLMAGAGAPAPPGGLGVVAAVMVIWRHHQLPGPLQRAAAGKETGQFAAALGGSHHRLDQCRTQFVARTGESPRSWRRLDY